MAEGARWPLGGRNQEFALARPPIDMAGLPNAVVFSAGTDGTDGPTDAAGAIRRWFNLLARNSTPGAIWITTIRTTTSNRSTIW